MKEIGLMIELRVMENIFTLMVHNMKVNGSMINRMVLVQKHGKTVLFTKDNIKMVRKKAKAISSGKMALIIEVTLLITILKVMVPTPGLIRELIPENGETIRCMVKEPSLGQTRSNILVTMLMTRKKVMENSIGQTRSHIRDIGRMEFKMEKVY